MNLCDKSRRKLTELRGRAGVSTECSKVKQEEYQREEASATPVIAGPDLAGDWLSWINEPRDRFRQPAAAEAQRGFV